MKSAGLVPLVALLLAAVALVFAVWPVVGDAPWESTPAPAPAVPTVDPCIMLRTQLIEAAKGLAQDNGRIVVFAYNQVLDAGRNLGCWQP